MIFTLVFFLIILSFLAAFIGYNISNECSIWLLKNFTDVPVSVLVLISFGAGIVVSILVIIAAKLKKSASKENEISDSKETKNKFNNPKKAEKNQKNNKPADTEKNETKNKVSPIFKDKFSFKKDIFNKNKENTNSETGKTENE